jgi:hypothetical protein
LAGEIFSKAQTLPVNVCFIHRIIKKIIFFNDLFRKKNAPSLATWGKSTFSEGGGDNRCMQKSTLVRNCTGVFVALQQDGGCQLQKLVKLSTFKTTQVPCVQQG